MDRHRKGDLVEAIVISELKDRNIPVCIPFGDNERYDVLLETPDEGFLRGQIKTGRLREGTIRFDTKSHRTNASGNTYVSYEGDVDCFLVYCPEIESLYFVQAEGVTSKKMLRVDPSGIDHPHINWAEDYEFDTQWPGNVSKQTLPPHRRGDATEAFVIAELLKREISIAIPPTDNERFDLLAGTNENNYYRIQIKTGWVADGIIHFQGVSSHTNSQGNIYKPYDDDVDYFIVYVPSIKELYLIKEDEFDTRITIRLETPDVVHRDMNWAEDFEFDNNWPPNEAEKVESRKSRHRRELVERVSRELLDRSISVSHPMDSEEDYDLLAETPAQGVVRLSVRTPRFDGRRLILSADPGTVENVDYLVLYFHEAEQLYLVSTDSFETSISLWVDEPEEIRRNTKWAEDFEFDRNWPPSERPIVSKKSVIGVGISAFADLSVEVTRPVDDTVPYDILVEGNDLQYHRVAIVPSWPSRGCLRLKPDSCDGIDYFLLFSRDLESEYLIGADEFDRSISLRVEPPEKPDPTIRDAREYELARRWPPNARDRHPVND